MLCVCVFVLVYHDQSLTSLCICKELLIAQMFLWYLDRGGVSLQGSLNVKLFSSSPDFSRREEIKENQEKKCLGQKQ